MSKVVTLTDGRRGFFYRTWLMNHLMFQPVDDDDLSEGNPEMVFDDDYEVAE